MYSQETLMGGSVVCSIAANGFLLLHNNFMLYLSK